MKKLNLPDLVLIAVVLLVAVLLLSAKSLSSGNVTAEIYVEGELYKSIELSSVKESYREEIAGSVILVEPSGICYKESNCKDKLCVRQGKLARPGDVAACVPNRTVVTLRGGKKQPHVVTY